MVAGGYFARTRVRAIPPSRQCEVTHVTHVPAVTNGDAVGGWLEAGSFILGGVAGPSRAGYPVERERAVWRREIGAG